MNHKKQNEEVRNAEKKSEKKVKQGLAPETDHHGTTPYFEHGNTRIIITEHFTQDGKTMAELLEKEIMREAKCIGRQEAS